MTNEDRQTFRSKTLEGMDRLFEREPSGVCAIIVAEDENGGGSVINLQGEMSAGRITAKMIICMFEAAEELGISRERFVDAVVAAHLTEGMFAKTSEAKSGHA